MTTTHQVPTSFEAQAFHPDLPGGRGPGTVRVDSGRVVFEATGQDLRLELPFHGLEMRLGGASDRLVFFSHPDLAEVSVYTSDHRVLDHPSLASQAGVADQVRKVRGKKRRGRWTTASILAVVVLALVGLVAAKDPLVGFVADRVPPRLEVELGDVLFRQVALQVEIVHDAELEEGLEELAAPLLAAVGDAGYPFDLHLADDPSWNAFAMPGGHVVVNTGLVLGAQSAEEVQGVLAHELAHVTRRHSLRQLISAAGVYVLVQTLLGDVSGLMAVLADGGLRLLTLEFSRDHEREADDVGFDTLVAAGIDPRGLASFFERLKAKQEAEMGAATGLEGSLALLSTHPATGERLAHLEERRAGLEVAFEPSSFDFQDFQVRLRQTFVGTGSKTDAP